VSRYENLNKEVYKMTIDADHLQQAWDEYEEGKNRSTVQPAETLMGLAMEVADAFTTWKMTENDRQRLYARSLILLEKAVTKNHWYWQRHLRMDRRRGAVLGGSAALIAVAIGIALKRERRAAPASVRLAA
jgi:hypothetical protein